jgi:adenylate cyclase class IV
MEKLNKFTEFETKYEVDISLKEQFIAVMELTDYTGEVFFSGPDHYYINDDGNFLRYRKGELDGNRAEVTMKKKTTHGNNIIRQEVNWRVDSTPLETIAEGFGMLGYSFDFKIHKKGLIYLYKDANVVFYTVKSDNHKDRSFIEIELDEITIHNLTEEQAMERIRKYETILAPLGITYRNRLNKSLFEVYRN